VAAVEQPEVPGFVEDGHVVPITGWRNLALLISIAGLTGGCAPVWVDAGEHANPRRGALQSPAPACEHQDLPCPALVELGFTYPFAREPDSYLFLDGVVYPYAEVTADLLGDSRVLLPDGSTITVHRLLRAFGLEAEAFEPQTPVIGYGSNASPAQLTRKFIVEDFAGIPVIPVMKGTIEDYDVVFAPHFVSYGAMPATMVPMPGTDAEIWVNWLDDAELAQMNESEGAGGLYAFGDLSAEWDDAGPDPDTMKVYVDCFGGLEADGQLLALSAVPATGRTARAVTEPEALDAVLPTLGWRQSLFELLLTNVASERARDRRTGRIEALGVQFPDPNFAPEIPCSLSSEELAGRRALPVRRSKTVRRLAGSAIVPS
jgi:hypothetical protein